MKKVFNISIVVVLTLLFYFNDNVCDHYFDVGTEASEWWNLRFQFYSTYFTLAAIAIFVNGGRLIRILSLPLLVFTLGDWKDRVLFNSPTEHWSDWMLTIISIVGMIYLLLNVKTRRK